MRLIVTGHKQHGKDTVSGVICELTGMSFESSSHVLCEEVVFPVLKERYGYKTPEECYEDRDAHRPEWFNLLCEYNKNDKARLGKKIFEQYDIYCGLRNIDELVAQRAAGLVDVAIWVDASQRKPPESAESCTITREDCDYVIDNNGPEENLKGEIIKLLSELALHYPITIKLNQ